MWPLEVMTFLITPKIALCLSSAPRTVILVMLGFRQASQFFETSGHFFLNHFPGNRGMCKMLQKFKMAVVSDIILKKSETSWNDLF